MENNSIHEKDIPKLEKCLLILSGRQIENLAAKFRFADEIKNIAIDSKTSDIYIEYISEGILSTQIFKCGE